MTTAAIQGVRGAFSHVAALRALGADTAIHECRTFEDLFEAVGAGLASHGVVPVENSLAGSVQRTMDLLLAHPLHVVAEARVRVRLCVVVRPDTERAAVRRIGSHPVALPQCHGFFRRHEGAEPVAAFDTAGSVRDLMAGRADYDAAIGSELAASLYGGRILERDIEDDPHNYTRFLIVAAEPIDPPERGAKTSVVFRLRHRPGSLHDALGVLRAHGVDLTRLESRPIPGEPWEYRFHADLRGPAPRDQRAAVEALDAVATEVRVLGQYAEEVEAGEG